MTEQYQELSNVTISGVPVMTVTTRLLAALDKAYDAAPFAAGFE